MNIAEIIWALTRSRPWRTSNSRHLDGIVVENHSVDGGTVKLSDGAALQDDLVCSTSHFTDVGVLESSNPGIDRKRVQQHHLKQDSRVG